jgi:hypothetical protein
VPFPAGQSGVGHAPLVDRNPVGFDVGVDRDQGLGGEVDLVVVQPGDREPVVVHHRNPLSVQFVSVQEGDC